MSAKGQHGEPWEYKYEPRANMSRIQNGRYIFAGIPNEETEDDISAQHAHANRIVSCVNVLDGLNPEALAGLIEDARATARHLSCLNYPDCKDSHYEQDCCVCRLRAALKALGVEL